MKDRKRQRENVSDTDPFGGAVGPSTTKTYRTYKSGFTSGMYFLTKAVEVIFNTQFQLFQDH